MRGLPKFLFAVVAPVVALLVPIPAGAQPGQVQAEGNPCDSLAALADAWDDMATQADESGGLDKGMKRALADLRLGTLDVARTLQEEGEGRSVELAARLAAAVTASANSPSVGELVARLDTVVDRLDELVDLCDQEMASAEAGPAGGTVTVRYEPPADPALRPLAVLARDSGVFESIAGEISSILVLPADIETVFTSCGQANAFFDPDQGRVLMCYEFLALFEGVFSDGAADEAEVADAVLDVAAFFYLHELGHALVYDLDLPVTGREEDSVDALATLVLLHAGADGAVISAIEHFAALADLVESEGELEVWDEHSLDSQRLYDVACLVYGSDPETYTDMVAPDLLPAERAVRCPAEFEQKDRAWDTLLAPYYAADGG